VIVSVRGCTAALVSGVYVTVHVAEVEEPARVQAVENVPVLLVAKVTVPVGVIGEPTSVSVTVAVQRVALLTTTLVGVQLT